MADHFLGGSLSLQHPERINCWVDLEAGTLDGCTGTESSAERTDINMTSHSNNKNAEMSSAVVFSVHVSQRGVGGSLVHPMMQPGPSMPSRGREPGTALPQGTVD